MPDLKKASSLVAVILAASVGAAGGRLLAPTPKPATARVVKLRLDEGQLTAVVQVKTGANTQSKDILFDAKGESPRLDGKPFPAAADLGKAAAMFAKAAAAAADKLADPLNQ